MKYSILSLIALSVIVLVSCESDNDGDKPDITAPTITLEEPGFGEMFPVGGTIHFDALFEDDEGLATYNIEIHENFDGHAHGRLEVAPFDYDQSFELTGRINDVHEDIDITTDATAGPYHFIVVAIDAAGNSTTFAEGSSVEVEIWITNEEMAHVHFQDSTGVEVAEFEGEVDTPLQFYGEIEDGSGALDHVMIMVGHLEEGEGHNHDDHGGGRIAEEDHIFEQEFEVAGQTLVMIQDLLIDASIVVSQAEVDELEVGEHLYLIVQAEDEAGNISRHSIEIHFD